MDICAPNTLSESLYYVDCMHELCIYRIAALCGLIVLFASLSTHTHTHHQQINNVITPASNDTNIIYCDAI